MKLFRRFLTAIAIDALMTYCFYLWKFEGVEGAGNLVQFIFWMVVAFAFLVLLAPYANQISPKSTALHGYGALKALGFLIAFVWFGHYALAAGYVIAWLILEVHRDKYDAAGQLKPGVPNHLKSQ